MNYVDMEYFSYQTKPYETETACWTDLGAYLKEKNDMGWVWLRVVPEVNSERNFDTKETSYRGFVRGGVIPQDWDVLHIPGIGEA
jgi:hypothetical protein